MHKLLVPFDSSDSAMRALEHAIHLAKEKGPMEVVIVYAHEPPIIYGEIEIYLSEEKANKMVREHSEDILRPAIEKAKRAGITFTSQVLIGEPVGIVMGTRGMSAIGNLVMGSVATKVIHLTNLPVTLVK